MVRLGCNCAGSLVISNRFTVILTLTLATFSAECPPLPHFPFRRRHHHRIHFRVHPPSPCCRVPCARPTLPEGTVLPRLPLFHCAPRTIPFGLDVKRSLTDFPLRGCACFYTALRPSPQPSKTEIVSRKSHAPCAAACPADAASQRVNTPRHTWAVNQGS